MHDEEDKILELQIGSLWQQEILEILKIFGKFLAKFLAEKWKKLILKN